MYPQVIAEPGRRSAAKQAASCGGIWISGFSDEGSDTRDGLYTRDAEDGNGAPHYSNSASFHLYVNAAGEWCVNSQFHPETKTCAAFWKGNVAKLVDASWTDGGKPRRLAIAEVGAAGAAWLLADVEGAYETVTVADVMSALTHFNVDSRIRFQVHHWMTDRMRSLRI